jgi:hypothetical protein
MLTRGIVRKIAREKALRLQQYQHDKGGGHTKAFCEQ